MCIDMVFNDLSAPSPLCSRYVGRELMAVLVGTMTKAIRAGVNRRLLHLVNTECICLSENYPIAKWMNDNAVEREQRSFFRSLLTRSPSIEELEEATYDLLGNEFYFNGTASVGLGVAYLIDGISVSLQTSRTWSRIIIELELQQLQENGVIEQEFVGVHNASNEDHLDELSRWIDGRLEIAIESGRDIWNNRDRLFPSLIFCEEVEYQLSRIHRGNMDINLILTRLRRIEDYCCGWEYGPFDIRSIGKGSTESEGTMSMYGEERTFLCPDGRHRQFSLHTRINRNWRIYLHTYPGPGRLCIGYIGPHLRIATEE